MKKLFFKKLDAFAKGQSGGNPAAVIFLDAIDQLSDREMLLIAKQMRNFVSEVAYVFRETQNEFKVRYFSSEREVQFCGHASIAFCYDLIKNDIELYHTEKIILHTNKNRLEVLNNIREEDVVYIAAPLPQFYECSIDINEMADSLGLKAKQIDDSVKPGIVNAGNTTLCLPLKGLEDVTGVSPDFTRQKEFCKKHGLDVVNVFTFNVSFASSYLRSRVFAAPFGYLEDPATGSGNAALMYHLYGEGLWNGETVTLEQGKDIAHPNIVAIKGRLDANSPVMFGGNCVVRIEGSYFI